MRRVPPTVQHVVTGILLALAVAAVGAATHNRHGESAVAAGVTGPTGASFTNRIQRDLAKVGDPGVRVALVLSGDPGQYAGMCAGAGGPDSLTGTLVRDGSGPVASDEDVMYRGLLSRTTHLSACGTKPAPTEDQVDMCLATLVGNAKMNVELEINEGDRGAWIKMKADSQHAVTELVSGCPEPAEWLKEYYPDGASGVGIETVPSGLLQVPKRYTEGGVSLETIR
jgi:hypothetical protein